MRQEKVCVTKKAKVELLLKMLYKEEQLDNDTYILARKLAKEVKENGDM